MGGEVRSGLLKGTFEGLTWVEGVAEALPRVAAGVSAEGVVVGSIAIGAVSFVPQVVQGSAGFYLLKKKQSHQNKILRNL